MQLVEDYDHSEEPYWKSVGKDDHSKTRKDGEEVIQAASDFSDLEQVIKGVDRVRSNNIGDDLKSVIKEDTGKKGNDLETVGKDNFFKSVDQEDLETVGREDSKPPNPPAPPRISQRTFDKEDLDIVGQEDYVPPKPPAPPIRSQRKNGPPSCCIGTRAQEWEKANNVDVGRLTKGY